MLEKQQNITHCRHLKKTFHHCQRFEILEDTLVFVRRGKPNLLDMGSLLIKPVQRVMKYPLLLSELWQATPEDHPDYRPLQEALTATKIINVNINEFRRRKDIGEISHTHTHKAATRALLQVQVFQIPFASDEV